MVLIIRFQDVLTRQHQFITSTAYTL